MAERIRKSKSELASQYFGEIIKSPTEMQEFLTDLDNLGIPESGYSSLHVTRSSVDVERWVRNAFSLKENVIIFGTKGFGKTSIINQAAAQFGYRVQTLSLSAMLPEDLGGYPAPAQFDVPEDLLLRRAEKEVYRQKLADAVNAEMAKSSSVSNISLRKNRLEKKLAPTITVSEDEVKALLDTWDDRQKKRWELVPIAPRWVLQIQDAYLRKGQITVLFLDEINQGRPDILNTLYDLVQNRRFGNMDEYSMSDAVLIAGAGNFERENKNVNALSQPLLDRFSFRIIYLGSWKASISWLKKNYLEYADDYPELAKLFASSSVKIDDWEDSFNSPRDAERCPYRLMELEDWSKSGDKEKLAAFTTLDDVGLSEYNKTPLANAVRRFLGDIGVPAFAQYASNLQTDVDQKTLERAQRQLESFTKRWIQFLNGYAVDVPGDLKKYSNKNISLLEFFRVLLAGCSLITREGLTTVIDPTTNKDVITLLKAEPGFTPDILPTK